MGAGIPEGEGSGATVGEGVPEGEGPGAIGEAVHGVEIGGRLVLRLPPRQEDDPRDGGGHAALQGLHRRLQPPQLRNSPTAPYT